MNIIDYKHITIIMLKIVKSFGSSKTFRNFALLLN